jgi:superfamily I DNA and/or RNA helicase
MTYSSSHPNNMQVSLLRSILPDGARVATVNKFQGEEAEAVTVSITTSGADELLRDASFLLSHCM